MKEELENKEFGQERPNSFWFRVYAAVFIFMVFVISGLAFFSWYFSR